MPNQWIANTLGLYRIRDPIINLLIDVGTISLAKASVLAKLSQEDQTRFLDDAIKLPYYEFHDVVAQHLRALTCPDCGGTGQDVPGPDDYHGLCDTCKGTGTLKGN